MAYWVWGWACIALVLAAWQPTITQGLDEPTSRHEEGLHTDRPDTYALTGARIQVDPRTVIDAGTLVVADGKIVAVGEQVDIPAAARVIDATGLTIMAAPIDAYAPVTVASDEADNALYWNGEVRPERSTVVGYRPDAQQESAWRAQGFGARLFAPDSGILRGQGALISLSDQPFEQRVLAAAPTQHALLTLSRRGSRDAYPNSPMGAYAVARQALYDAQWYAEAVKVAEADPRVERPEYNRSLEALGDVIARGTPLVVEAANEAFVLRADRFAREFNLSLIVVGSGEEYQRLAEIQQSGRTLILPVDFPAPPDVATVERAADVSLETLMHWDLAPENPARVADAGIEFALTTYGIEEPAKFWPQVRKAIERGLSPETALAAMTTVPAEMFGVSDQVGTLEPGKLANFIVCSDSPLTSEAKIHETWIAGRRYEINAPQESHAIGRWRLRFTPRLPAADQPHRDASVKGEWGQPGT
ncbi:MAG: amidohydrolase family protein [Pirellulaceae bacterium]